MSESDRAAFLHNLGYEEPFDESPIDVSDGWFGGSIANTGGNIMCRIWRTWEDERERDTEYEVIYGVSQDASVALQAYTWDEKYDSYIYDWTIESRDAENQSDDARLRLLRS